MYYWSCYFYHYYYWNAIFLCDLQLYPMAVVGTASRGVIIYQLENQPQEFKRIESPLKYQVTQGRWTQHPMHHWWHIIFHIKTVKYKVVYMDCNIKNKVNACCKSVCKLHKFLVTKGHISIWPKVWFTNVFEKRSNWTKCQLNLLFLDLHCYFHILLWKTKIFSDKKSDYPYHM